MQGLPTGATVIQGHRRVWVQEVRAKFESNISLQHTLVASLQVFMYVLTFFIQNKKKGKKDINESCSLSLYCKPVKQLIDSI